MPQTRGGIYHNLRESKYTVSKQGIVYFFSSNTYRKHFMDRYPENRKKVSKKLAFLANDAYFNFTEIADLQLYNELEKRGFYVEIEGEEISWQNCVQFALRQMTNKNIENWQITYGRK